MQPTLRITSLALLLLTAALVFPAAPLYAQGDSEDAVPFYFNGHVWANKQAFIEHARCGTRPVTLDEMEEVDQLVASRTLAGIQATGGTINVYFHVIKKGSGIANGDVPNSQINDQIDGYERLLRRERLSL